MCALKSVSVSWDSQLVRSYLVEKKQAQIFKINLGNYEENWKYLTS